MESPRVRSDLGSPAAAAAVLPVISVVIIQIATPFGETVNIPQAKVAVKRCWPMADGSGAGVEGTTCRSVAGGEGGGERSVE